MTCVFLPCADVTTCCLVGGCVVTRFPAPHPEPVDTRARPLNGTTPKRAKAKP